MIECLTQRLELNCLIPAIRNEMILLLERKGLSDADISRKLGITRAAVSQYKHKKRGSRIKFDQKISSEIKLSAERIFEGKKADFEISGIIKKMKESREICRICKGECQ